MIPAFDASSSSSSFATRRTRWGFSTALTYLMDNYGSGLLPRCVPELQILELQGIIKEKDEWWTKIHNPTIASKWNTELVQQLDDVYCSGSPPSTTPTSPLNTLTLSSFPRSHDYHVQMVDFAIAECQYWALHYQEGPVRPAAAEGVFVRDDLKTNTGDLHADLLREIAVLRDQPAIGSTEIDRHPGTPQIIDLVHPSLYAYERGQTMVLEGAAGGANVTQMPEWSSFLGKQGVVEQEKQSDSNPSSHPLANHHGGVYSDLQWLPAEFRVSANGQDCDITSYINSLHPIQHAQLYPLIGKLFCHCVPLLEQVLAELGKAPLSTGLQKPPRERQLRIQPDHWWDGEPDEQGSDQEDSDYEEYYENWYDDLSRFIPPTIPKFASPPPFTQNRDDTISLRDRPLQVIVKIASMELKPNRGAENEDENLSSYKGGVWHVEGTVAERIVATACCYLESTNVQGGELAFRTSVHEPDYEQSDNTGVQLMYNLVDEGPLLQPLGLPCVTKEGRILAWPNTKQHCVQPVSLVDPTKSGKRTILCFFLVDPTLRIRSTATVPPQQLAWVQEGVYNPALTELESEPALRQQIATLAASAVSASSGATPKNSLLTYEQACERRLRLMEERGHDQTGNGDVQEGHVTGGVVRTFSLCEH